MCDAANFVVMGISRKWRQLRLTFSVGTMLSCWTSRNQTFPQYSSFFHVWPHLGYEAIHRLSLVRQALHIFHPALHFPRSTLGFMFCGRYLLGRGNNNLHTNELYSLIFAPVLLYSFISTSLTYAFTLLPLCLPFHVDVPSRIALPSENKRFFGQASSSAPVHFSRREIFLEHFLFCLI